MGKHAANILDPHYNVLGVLPIKSHVKERQHCIGAMWKHQDMLENLS